MSTVTAAPARFTVRGVQLARAGFAALAAAMITFSPDHSAALGLSVFSGFAIATGLVWFVAAWLTYPAGQRSGALVVGTLTLVAGMVAAIGPMRSTTTFFVLVIVWAAASAGVELAWGLVDRRRGTVPRAQWRDQVVVASFGFLLAIATALVPAGFALNYTISDKGQNHDFTLTGIIIAVGIFGAYAAVIAVYLAIAGLSPRAEVASAVGAASGQAEAEETR
ncbi:acyl-CoA synthetase [uncultured Microbacterium sp.]|uniref:acyl-CoA synthetase n=1 Tax=uncultured Microbacterium sp. TaxID=191216 RepID=UPI0025D40FBC|nr:acyl-CoA synthetase [uncultured Microbacterium sp.]